MNKVFSNIKMVLTDCDGVLTDGGMYYGENGEEFKKFNTKDGMAVSLLKARGIKFGIITGENSQIVVNRANKLVADECHIGVKNKLQVLNEIRDKHGLLNSEVAYIGDDINDIEILKRVGISFAVNDAVKSVKDIAQFTTLAKGGEGALREVADLILLGRIEK